MADGTDIVVSGAADGSVKVWRLTVNDGTQGDLVKTIILNPRYFPLALSLSRLETDSEERPVVLAAAGTTNIVQIYVAESTIEEPDFKLRATLSGHEAWVRSLSFTNDKQSQAGDLLLASASQDKYIRLWRVHRGEAAQAMPADDSDPMLGGLEPTRPTRRMSLKQQGRNILSPLRHFFLGMKIGSTPQHGIQTRSGSSFFLLQQIIP